MSEKLRFRKYMKPKPKKIGVAESRNKRYVTYFEVADPLAEAKAKLDKPKEAKRKIPALFNPLHMPSFLMPSPILTGFDADLRPIRLSLAIGIGSIGSTSLAIKTK